MINLEKYIGSFNVTIETESTTTGMANITYDFIIKRNNAVLKK